ncbi:hypothetical protein [Streptomyces sp. NPDC006863]|uniref:hypothetical protein n=1 Tax=Streptomyces sp. NPDC006863 TaxID=3154779 RepID=UPI0033D36014
MKLHHKINHGWQRPSDPVSETYQREVDRSVEKSEVKWRRAQKAVERATKAKERAERRAAEKPTPTLLAAQEAARRLLLQRLDELRQIEVLMRTPTHVPPTAVHRTGRQDRLEVGQYRKPRKRKTSKQPVKTRRSS